MSRKAVQAKATLRRKGQVAKGEVKAKAEARLKEAAAKDQVRGQTKLQTAEVFASITTMLKSVADALIAVSFMFVLNASSDILPTSAVARHRLLMLAFRPLKLREAGQGALDN